MSWNWIGPPCDVRPLFPAERSELLDLLGILTAEQWDMPTCCPNWRVQDIVAHLVHDYARRLAGTRDAYGGPGFRDGEDLPQYLGRVNQEFVTAATAFSPRLLTDLIDFLGPQLDQMWAELELDELGTDVWWAEPDVRAPRWLDVGREFTEFWIHQQQIRIAVGRPGARGRELVDAVVDILVRGLPRALSLHAPPASPADATVRVTVTGAASTEWLAVRQSGGRWTLRRPPAASASSSYDVDADLSGAAPHLDADVSVDADVLWQLAARMISPAEAARQARFSGDTRLGQATTRLLSIIR